MKNILLLMAIFTTCHVQAQYYRSSSGLRLGYTSGITFKRFVNKQQAIEVMLSGRDSGLQITGLYHFNRPLINPLSDNLYLFYGVGMHLGYERHTVNRPGSVSRDRFSDGKASFFAMGVDTNIGVEYRWLVIPLTLSLDFKPFLNVVGFRTTRFRFWDFAFSVKYVF